jgi:hypothetical protein
MKDSILFTSLIRFLLFFARKRRRVPISPAQLDHLTFVFHLTSVLGYLTSKRFNKKDPQINLRVLFIKSFAG